jgi:hypothetical protein
MAHEDKPARDEQKAMDEAASVESKLDEFYRLDFRTIPPEVRKQWIAAEPPRGPVLTDTLPPSGGPEEQGSDDEAAPGSSKVSAPRAPEGQPGESLREAPGATPGNRVKRSARAIRTTALVAAVVLGAAVLGLGVAAMRLLGGGDAPAPERSDAPSRASEAPPEPGAPQRSTKSPAPSGFSEGLQVASGAPSAAPSIGTPPAVALSSEPAAAGVRGASANGLAAKPASPPTAPRQSESPRLPVKRLPAKPRARGGAPIDIETPLL